MSSTIILLNNELEEKYAAKYLLDCTVLETVAYNMHEAGIDNVYVVNQGISNELRGIEVCGTLYDAINAIGWNNDGDLLIVDGLYPYIKKESYVELLALETAMVEGRHILKLKVSQLKEINELNFDIYNIDEDEMKKLEDEEDLAKYSYKFNKNVIKKHINNGVFFVDYKHSYVGPFVEIAKGVTIYPDVIIEGDSVIGENTTISSGSHFVNAVIGSECQILASRITDSTIGNKVKMGPNAHMRMHCEVGDEVRIGNYVEFKNTKFGYKSRCAHLTYLGDSEVGEDVNIGCGVVTVNYDGAHKFKTVIGDRAFIGSNANLIAPINVGSYAVVAAGSTVNKDVPDGNMGIARCRQENKEGFGYKYINKEK